MSGGLYRDLRAWDRVVLTEEGCRHGLQGRARTPFGVVVEVDSRRCLVKVRRDGIKGAGWYSPGFWERREDETKPKEEEVALKNQLVNAFVQGARWMIGADGLFPMRISKDCIVDEAKRRLREGTLGVDELTAVSIDDADFKGHEQERTRG